MAARGVFTDDYYNAIEVLPQILTTVFSGATGTAVPAQVFGGQTTVMVAATATAITTPTAAAWYATVQAALPNTTLLTYILRVSTASAGLTLTGGTGVTIVGTATVATGAYRDFAVTVTGPNSITLTNIGGGTT